MFKKVRKQGVGVQDFEPPKDRFTG